MEKLYIATKVYSKDCLVCEHMSRIDRSTFEGFPSIGYQEEDLDNIIEHGGNPTRFRLYQILERHAINPDYTVDVPVYIIMSKQGKYLGHHSGEATIVQLRNEIRRILEEDP